MKWIWFVVALAMLPVAGYSQTHKRHRKSPKKVGQLKRDLARVRHQKTAIRAQLRKTNRAVSEVLGDIAQVDGRLTGIESQLASTTDALTASRSEQRRLESDLADATDRLATLRDQMGKRIRRMVIEGNGSVLAEFAGAKTIGDVASREYVVERIAKQDRKLFDDYRNLKDAVADRVRRQAALVDKVAGLVDDQKSQQRSLQDTRDEKGQFLEELRQKQGELKEALAQFEADEQEIGAEIVAYSAKSRAGGHESLPAFKGRFSRPVSGPITSGFGIRYHPILHKTRLHSGVDFGAAMGSPVHAAAAGVVISARYMRGYGNTIIVDHGGGIATVYGHLSRLLVSNGERVTRGQHIGAVGATGLATGPHLHFEVRVNGHPVNPLGKF